MQRFKDLRFEKLLPFIMILLFFLLFTSIPLWDPDFWWHMKTGEYIFSNTALPDEDPFGSISPDSNPLRYEVLLKRYWLAQVILYTIWNALGIKGIILLRALILTLTLVIIYLLLRQATKPLLVSMVIFLTGGVMLYFTGERPQMFALPILALMVFMIEGYRQQRSACFYALPLLMLIWGNLHGSYLLGDLLIAFLLIVEFIKYMLGRSDFSKRQLRIFILISATAIISSLLNPVFYKTFLLYLRFHSGILIRGAIEHMSPIKLAVLYRKYFICFWILSAFISVCIFLGRQRGFNIWHLVTLILFTLSLYGARYMVFFAIIAPLSLKDISDVRIFNSKRLSFLLSSLLILIMVTGIVKNRPFNFSIINTYPEKAVEFVKGLNMRGNIFNYFDWGGYLIARLPDSDIFIDGRILDEERYITYNLIIEGVEIGKRKEWQMLLDANNIDMIILPIRDLNTGEPLRLIPSLLRSNSWSVLYNDGTSVVFIKRALL